MDQPVLYILAHADNLCGIPLYILPNKPVPLDNTHIYIVRNGHKPGIFICK
jgi:hypothetical protein